MPHFGLVEFGERQDTRTNWAALMHCSRPPDDQSRKRVASWTGKSPEILVAMSPCWACRRGCHEETASVEFTLNNLTRTTAISARKSARKSVSVPWNLVIIKLGWQCDMVDFALSSVARSIGVSRYTCKSQMAYSIKYCTQVGYISSLFKRMKNHPPKGAWLWSYDSFKF